MSADEGEDLQLNLLDEGLRRPQAPAESAGPSPRRTATKRKLLAGGGSRPAAASPDLTVRPAPPVVGGPPKPEPRAELTLARPVQRPVRPVTEDSDPMQHHARPRDLSRNALLAPRPATADPAHVFSRTPFSALPLPERLVGTLERAEADGGLGLATATRVQSAVIPLLAERGANLLMKSETGSGKTLAYLLPILSQLMSSPSGDRSGGTRALVIVPTRELSMQICDTLARLTRCCVWVVSGSISGGEKRKSEKARLRKGLVVLVATPGRVRYLVATLRRLTNVYSLGRLLDHLKTTESFRLSQLRWVVLDEADRLLDMGFEQTILQVLSIIRGTRLPGLKEAAANEEEKAGSAVTLDQRWRRANSAGAKTCADAQTLFHVMASATMTKAVRALAVPVLGDSRFFFVDADAETVEEVSDASALSAAGQPDKRKRAAVEVKDGVVHFDDEPKDAAAEKRPRSGALAEGEGVTAPSQLRQYFMLVSCKWRLAALVSFLRAHSREKLMVFFGTCDSVDFHALLLRQAAWPETLDPDQPDGAADLGKAQSLEPLPPKFSGMLGEECTLYRLHGNVPQRTRQEVYRDFCRAASGVLLCTDVAARGLDLPRIDWILQYDPPCETVSCVTRASL